MICVGLAYGWAAVTSCPALSKQPNNSVGLSMGQPSGKAKNDIKSSLLHTALQVISCMLCITRFKIS
jgi:hypothetical protein